MVQVKTPYIVGNIPDLFAENGTPLYEAVELSTYLNGLQSLGYAFDTDWTELGTEFSLQDGQVVLDGDVLPGIYVGTTPLAINYMAGEDDPFFINNQPANGLLAKSLSEHGVVLPAPSGSGGN